jgi:hypothetical protein
MYSFDSTNLPALTGTLLAGAELRHIPLRLDKDADFYLRAFDTQGAVSIRIEDADGNALSDFGYSQQSNNYELPPEYSGTAGAGFVALESGVGGVFGPAGGIYILHLYNATAATINLTTCVLSLMGVKRYHEGVCKA